MKSVVLKYVVILAGFILFTWVLWGFPEAFDTIRFQLIYFGSGGGEDTLSLSALGDVLSYLYYRDNLRLAQVISVPFSLFVPHILVSALLSALLVVSFYYAVALCFPAADLRPGRPSWKQLVWFWLVATLFLPWRANVFTIIYSENYFPSMAGLIWCLWRVARGRFTRGQLWLFGLVVFLTSWTHEQAAATLWCGAALYILLQRFRVSAPYWIMTLIGLSVFTAMALIPGTTSRFNDMTPVIYHLWYYKYILGMHIWVLLMLGLMAVMTCIRSARPYLLAVLSAPQYLILLVGAVACITMNCATYCPMRAALIPDLCAMVLMTALLRPVWNVLRCKVSYAFTACTGVILVSLICLWSHIALWQTRIGSEYEWAQKTILTPGPSPVYYDFKYIDAAPATALGIPQRNIIDIMFININHITGNERFVIPTDLQGRFMGRAVPVDGYFGAYRVNKTLFRVQEGWDCESRVKITFADGEVRNYTLLGIPFDGEDGVRYLAYHTPKMDVRDIVRIDLQQ